MITYDNALRSNKLFTYLLLSLSLPSFLHPVSNSNGFGFTTCKERYFCGCFLTFSLFCEGVMGIGLDLRWSS